MYLIRQRKENEPIGEVQISIQFKIRNPEETESNRSTNQ